MKSLFQMTEDWIGVPFRWHGRDRNGCDCIGLIIGVLHENKIMSDKDLCYFNNIKYGTNLSKINKSFMIKEINKFFKKTSSINEADLLIIDCKNSPIHFAINQCNTDENKKKQIIHVSQEIGKVFKTNLDPQLNIIQKFKLLY